MTFSVFPNLRCPGVTKHGQNSESADQDWPDVPGFLSFSYTVHAQTAASFPGTYTHRWPYCLHRSTVWLVRESFQNRHHFRQIQLFQTEKSFYFLISTAILMSFDPHSLCPSKIRYSIRRIAVPANRLCQNNRICPLAMFHRLHQPASLYYPCHVMPSADADSWRGYFLYWYKNGNPYTEGISDDDEGTYKFHCGASSFHDPGGRQYSGHERRKDYRTGKSWYPAGTERLLCNAV